LSRWSPRLARGAAHQRAIDLEPQSFEHGLDVYAAQRIVKKKNDLGLLSQLRFELLRQGSSLVARAILNLALEGGCKAHVAAAEAHQTQGQAVFGELLVRH